ncbi:hypothetical protein V1514DRAFT_328487 [Lipomyces japonicus]|uniref:uncharacterized protein n=1 Tax=Lipomyces japonicus TaxID=56871 RepID=UPI0034CED5FB
MRSLNSRLLQDQRCFYGHWLVRSSVLQAGSVAITVVTVTLLAYNFLFPWFQPALCSWPWLSSLFAEYDAQTDLRMLLFADPQIRGASGDSSLRTRLDLYGNDQFLGHVYSTMARQLNPSHVVVLGDLFSSQWINDDEFEARAKRLNNRIFTRHAPANNRPVFVNLSGNHDIGYAHDVTTSRVSRFEAQFGQLNYVISTESYRMIVFNSMSLDGSLDDNDDGQADYANAVKQFLTDQMNIDFPGSTILLTHVPLHKPAGVCADPPLFTYYDQNNSLIREQNMISQDYSTWLLDGFFSNRPGIIINGHDHEGCMVVHVNDRREHDHDHDHEHGQGWRAVGLASGQARYEYTFPNQDFSANRASVLELTVRSMMGEFGGNTGLLQCSWNRDREQFDYSYSLCRYGVQHVWWLTHVMSMASVIAVGFTFAVWPAFERRHRRKSDFAAGIATPVILELEDSALLSTGSSTSMAAVAPARPRTPLSFGVGTKSSKGE